MKSAGFRSTLVVDPKKVSPFFSAQKSQKTPRPGRFTSICARESNPCGTCPVCRCAGRCGRRSSRAGLATDSPGVGRGGSRRSSRGRPRSPGPEGLARRRSQRRDASWAGPSRRPRGRNRRAAGFRASAFLSKAFLMSSRKRARMMQPPRHNRAIWPLLSFQPNSLAAASSCTKPWA